MWALPCTMHKWLICCYKFVTVVVWTVLQWKISVILHRWLCLPSCVPSVHFCTKFITYIFKNINLYMPFLLIDESRNPLISRLAPVVSLNLSLCFRMVLDFLPWNALFRLFLSPNPFLSQNLLPGFSKFEFQEAVDLSF